MAVDREGNAFVAGSTEGTLPGQTRAGAWDAFLNKWGIARNSSQFWSVSDDLNEYLRRSDPVSAGILDYTRYDIWTEKPTWPRR